MEGHVRKRARIAGRAPMPALADAGAAYRVLGHTKRLYRVSGTERAPGVEIFERVRDVVPGVSGLQVVGLGVDESVVGASVTAVAPSE